MIPINHQPNGTLASAVQSERSTCPATGMLELNRPECLRLLAAASVGRIAVSVIGWDHPLIRPVNYVFDEPSQSVLLRSALGSKLHAVLQSARAAFEIDGIDPERRVGWSVIILGVSEEITDPTELRRIARLGLEPWPPGHKSHWIRIRAQTVSGRRIALVPDQAPRRYTATGWGLPAPLTQPVGPIEQEGIDESLDDHKPGTETTRAADPPLER